MAKPKPIVDAVTELAKGRSRGAAERTLLAWVQNCALLMGTGIALSQVAEAVRHFHPDDQGAVLYLSEETGLLFLGVGLVLLVAAVFAYSLEIKAINRRDYLHAPSRTFALIAIASVIVFGLSAIVLLGLGSLIPLLSQ
jgi:putative membrane protein